MSYRNNPHQQQLHPLDVMAQQQGCFVEGEDHLAVLRAEPPHHEQHDGGAEDNNYSSVPYTQQDPAQESSLSSLSTILTERQPSQTLTTQLIVVQLPPPHHHQQQTRQEEQRWQQRHRALNSNSSNHLHDSGSMVSSLKTSEIVLDDIAHLDLTRRTGSSRSVMGEDKKDRRRRRASKPRKDGDLNEKSSSGDRDGVPAFSRRMSAPTMSPLAVSHRQDERIEFLKAPPVPEPSFARNDARTTSSQASVYSNDDELQFAAASAARHGYSDQGFRTNVVTPDHGGLAEPQRKTPSRRNSDRQGSSYNTDYAQNSHGYRAPHQQQYLQQPKRQSTYESLSSYHQQSSAHVPPPPQQQQDRFSQQAKPRQPRRGRRQRPHRPMIPVLPGLSVPLRGCDETWLAFCQRRVVALDCSSCQTFIYCIDSATMVLCPRCRLVSPVEPILDLDGLPSSSLHEPSLGLGLTVEMISEEMAARRG